MNNYSDRAQYDFSRMVAAHIDKYGPISEIQEAVLFAQAVELQLLKAPQTAVFPTMEQFNVVNNGQGGYTVSGFVDAQNSYGANVRTPFSLTVMKVSGRWTCANKFVSTEKQIQSSMTKNTILWWILGLAGTIITYFIISASVSSSLDF